MFLPLPFSSFSFYYQSFSTFLLSSYISSNLDLPLEPPLLLGLLSSAVRKEDLFELQISSMSSTYLMGTFIYEYNSIKLSLDYNNSIILQFLSFSHLMNREKHRQIPNKPHRNHEENYNQFFAALTHKNPQQLNKKDAQSSPKKDMMALLLPKESASTFKQLQQTFTSQKEFDDRKLLALISEAISSADRVVKGILPYSYPEIQKHCSHYFLNKQKLYSYIENIYHSSLTQSQKIGRTVARKNKKMSSSNSSEQTQPIPIGHLQRLQKIINDKIIPILEGELEHEKKKSSKLLKRGKQEGFGQLKEGILLLQRLKQKDRIAVDECAQILEKFIVRMMNKQEKIMSKLKKLQEKLEDQIKKTEILSEQSKKWEDYRVKTEKQWNKQKKHLYQYEIFAKDVKSIFYQKDNKQIPQKTYLSEMINSIKKLVNNEQKGSRKDKKCDHKHKDVHAVCKEDSIKSQQQIKSLKDVIKSLDQQLGLLREQCQNIDERLNKANQKSNKLQNKSKKTLEQNQQLNIKVDDLIKDQIYKDKLIGEYLNMIAKLQESLQESEDNVAKLNEENQGYLQIVTHKSEQKEGYIRHILEIQQKQKELEEIIARKDGQIEEIFNNLIAKQKEISQYESAISQMQKQIKELNESIKTKQQQKIVQEEQLSHKLKGQKQLQHSDNSDGKESLPIKQFDPSLSTEIKLISKINTLAKQNEELRTLLMKQEKQEKRVDIDVQTQSAAILIEDNIDEAWMNEGKKKQERDDFIPESINKQTIQDILKEQLTDKIILESHKDKDIVENYIEGKAKSQEIEKNTKLKNQNDSTIKISSNGCFSQSEIQKISPKKDVYPRQYQSLNDQIDKNKPRSNIEVDSYNSKAKHTPQLQNQSKFQERLAMQNSERRLLQTIQNDYKEQMNVLGEGQAMLDAEQFKIQELLRLTESIGKSVTQLREKVNTQINDIKQLSQIKHQVDYMSALLHICKKNTLKKLQKMKKTETLQKQAEREIQRLKHQLDEALIANPGFSSIQSNSDGSGFTIPDHLQSFFRQTTKIMDTYHLKTLKQKQSKQNYAQTDDYNAAEHSIHPVVIQSQVIMQVQHAPLSEVKQQDKRSFIQELNEPFPMPQRQRIQSFVVSGDYRQYSNPKETLASPQTNRKQANPEDEFDSNSKRESEIRQLKQIGNMIDYHRQQILNLNQLLRLQTAEINTPSESANNSFPTTPQRHENGNAQYFKNLLNAPSKQHNQPSIDEKQVKQQQQQLKSMFAQRQQHFSDLFLEKDQQIQRLKAIIKNLTKVQQVDEKPSLKGSRNASKQMQNLKNQNEQLWMFMQKEKMEIQRLQILIRQYQLGQELRKAKDASKASASEQTIKQEVNPFEIQDGLIQDNKAFMYQISPAKLVDKQQPKQFQEIQQAHSQQEINLPAQKIEQKEEQAQVKQAKPIEEGKNHVQISPSKRFARKSEKFTKQQSPREKRHTSPSTAFKFGWQQIVPQFFGSPKKR